MNCISNHPNQRYSQKSSGVLGQSKYSPLKQHERSQIKSHQAPKELGISALVEANQLRQLAGDAYSQNETLATEARKKLKEKYSISYEKGVWIFKTPDLREYEALSNAPVGDLAAHQEIA